MLQKEITVSALENGTVIDHIAKGKGMEVLKILGLRDSNEQIYLGINASSQKYGYKDLIKISNRFFEMPEINKIALISPTATIIEIKNYEIQKKMQVEIPDEIHISVKCANPNCITNVENVPTKFKVTDKINLKMQCRYCEKNTTAATMEFLS